MHRGYIKLWRSSVDNKLYFAEPFTKWQAWQDLLLLANHKENTPFVRGIPVFVGKGQVMAAEEFLAGRWKWSRGKVRRFLLYLESETVQQISRQTVQQNSKVTSIISIVNWEIYQGNGITDDTTKLSEDDTTNGTTKSQQTVQQTDIPKNGNNGKNVKNTTGIPPVVPQKEAPNIFTLYEQEIGKLTPEVSDALKDLEKQYPADWIPLAFKEAAGRARSWKYIEGILKRWSAEGGPLPPAAPGAKDAANAALLAAAQEQPSPDIDPIAAWDQVKALVKKRVNATNYDTHFEGTIGKEWRGVCLVVQVSKFSTEYYATRIHSIIESALIEVTGNKCLVICEESTEVTR